MNLKKMYERLIEHDKNKYEKESNELYKKALKNKIPRSGHTKKQVMAACEYIIYRKNHLPITLDDMMYFYTIDRNDIGKTYLLIKKELNINVPVQKPSNFIPLIVEELDFDELSDEIENLAVKISKKSFSKGITSGSDPRTIAAACVYISSKINARPRTQTAVAYVSGIARISLRKNYKKILLSLLDVEDLVRKSKY